ncbi:hypothetical protein FRC02_008889 [Tulasnella sp. 418]|nr:hypothetical protein FRC02_008889 [Tulasnella sp. 418]
MSENQENAPSESLKPYSYEGGYSSFSTTIDNSGTSNIRFLGDMENNSTAWVTNDDDTDMSESAYDGELSDFAPSIPWRGLTDESNPSRAPSINSYHSSMGWLHPVERVPSTHPT